MNQSLEKTNENQLKTKSDFEFLKEIGEGSFSTVKLAKCKKSGNLFAKKRILSEYLKEHPFFVKLFFTFQDDDSLYFGLSYCSNGDLLQHIQKNGQLTLDKSKFFTAEIVDALEFMHGKKIIHRDLKPENILLDENFHTKITDFGSARIIDDPLEQKQLQEGNTSLGRRKNSFVGTAQFVSPEILNGKEPHLGTDLWSLGCIIYQMLSGKHLFTGNHEYDIFQKVVKLDYSIKEDFDVNAKDLIEKLVVKDPNQRLGASDNYSLLKAHPYFEHIKWMNLIETQVPK